MAIYPEATYKPITARKGRKRLTVYNRVNLHVAASEAHSLHGFFNVSGREDSHFYVRKDGTCEQYVDTAYQAFADLDGNDATISIETQGGAKNANGEKWTDAQVKTLADIYRWAMETHGIARKIAVSSQPGQPSKGLSWHRLGVDGNFPKMPDILAGRIQRGGGMRYSRHFGKVCPGDAKIKQIPLIFDLATASPVPAPKPKPKPAPEPKKDLKDDGLWGENTTRRAQEVAKTPRDGKVSGQESQHKRAELTSGWQWEQPGEGKGSQLIAHLQDEMKSYKGKIDGIAGPQFWAAFRKELGTKSTKNAIVRFQRNLNEGKLF